MNIRFRLKIRQIVKWTLAVIALGWMFGAIWFLFIQAAPANNIYGSSSGYGSQQSKIAKCRGFSTSEARYQCTSDLMLAKDNETFNQALVVVLPAFALVIGYLGVTRTIAAHRERVRSRTALAASRKRLAEWRRHLKEVKSAAAAQQTGGALAPVPARPLNGIRPRPARKQ